MYAYEHMTEIGPLTILSDGEAICEIEFCGLLEYGRSQKRIGKVDCLKELELVAGAREIAVVEDTATWLDLYFAGRNPGTSPNLHLEGSPFQMEVWELLRQIPYGEVVTYGQLAETIAAKRGIRRMSSQAVGGAVGRNPIPVLVPCHRVIGADGSLTGFGGGMEKKIALLRREGHREWD